MMKELAAVDGAPRWRKDIIMLGVLYTLNKECAQGRMEGLFEVGRAGVLDKGTERWRGQPVGWRNLCAVD